MDKIGYGLSDWVSKFTDAIPATRAPRPPWSSKHAREPGAGDVRLGRDSGLRKLKRALRRGMVPAERMQVIETAERSAARRAKVYANRRLDATRPEPPIAEVFRTVDEVKQILEMRR